MSAENQENSNTLANISSNSFSLVSSAIDVTKKLLSESIFEYYGDFKGEDIWNSEINGFDSDSPIISLCEYENKLFIVCGDNKLRIVNASSGELMQEINYDNVFIDVKIYGGSYKNLILAAIDGYLYQINLVDYSLINKEQAYSHHDLAQIKHNDKWDSFRIEISPCGMFVLTSSRYLSDKVYDAIGLRILRCITNDNKPSDSLSFNNYSAFSFDSKHILKKNNGILKLYNLIDNANSGLYGYIGPICDISTNNRIWANTKGQVAFCGWTTPITIMDIQSPFKKHKFNATPENLDLSFSNSGKYLIVTSNDGYYIYDTVKFTLVYKYAIGFSKYKLLYKSCIFSKNDSSVFIFWVDYNKVRKIIKWK